MEEKGVKEDGWYRGSDLMNNQKKILYQKIMDNIKNKQSELSHLFDSLQKNHEYYDQYTKRLEYLRTKEDNPASIIVVEEKIAMINHKQQEILTVLQPLFHEAFDQVAEEIPPGIEYNDALRHDVRFDFIPGERDIDGQEERSMDIYRHKYTKKTNPVNIKKHKMKTIKSNGKEIPIRDHKLITKDNYTTIVQKIIPQIRKELIDYMTILGLDINNKVVAKNTLERLFLYILIRVLIDQKLVFETKSLQGKSVDDTINELLLYFQQKIGENLDITPMDIKRKLQNNLKSKQGPLDLSYQNAMIDDIHHWERYLNMFYFYPQGTNTNELRIQIMVEYNEGKGLIEKSFELLNPMYHMYKEQEEKHKKHLYTLKEHQRKNITPNPELQNIIQEMEQSLIYAQKKKKEHTIIEDRLEKNKPQNTISLGQILKKYMKKYKIPTQFHQIFMVILNKNNNFYQIKSSLIKSADKNNDFELKRYIDSDQTTKDFRLYMQLLCTNKMINDRFEQERTRKWQERKLILKNICINYDKITKKELIKNMKKKKILPENQLSIDF